MEARKIIDIHTHIFPDEIAPKAIPALGESGDVKASHNGTASGLKASMAQAGISKSALMPVATKPSQVAPINRWMSSMDRNSFIPFGTIYPGSDSVMPDIVEIAKLGLKGIKLHSNYQDFRPDDEFMFPIYEEIRRRGLLVLFHAGKDLSFEEVPASPVRLRRMIDKMPGLKVIAAHFGGYQCWEEVAEHLIGRDVYLETSYTLPFLEREKFVAMARAHGVDRVLFGTDSPWRNQREEVALISNYGLGDNELEKIFYCNAQQLLGNKN